MKAMQPEAQNNRIQASPGPAHGPRIFFYRGPSMNPTLKSGDVLHVQSYRDASIRCGDVIVFKVEAKSTVVAHRVISIGADRLRTRGDNTDNADPWTVSRSEVMGRVVSASRGGRSRVVHGGTLGQIRGRIVRLERVLRKRLVRLLQPSYRRVAAWGLFRWIARCTTTRVVSFSRPGMPPELHLEMGGRIIGLLLPGQERWRITPPFRLFIDEGSLPSREPCPPGQSSPPSGAFPVCE